MLQKEQMKKENVLLVGVGGFGRNHLKAWIELGYLDHLYVCERDPLKFDSIQKYGISISRISNDIDAFLDQVHLVDICTGSESHFKLAKWALQHDKDIFIEKPMTMTSREAHQLEPLVRGKNRKLQVGYYYRFHYLSQKLKSLMSELGDVRYIQGDFLGFKRARTDVGVMHTDGIHFIDLTNWLLETKPKMVYGFTKDHFKRGLEDLAVGHFFYPNDVILNLEAGYIQPGQWKDKVVAQAMTTKKIIVMGSKASVSVDFEAENIQYHDCKHMYQDGIWKLDYRGERSYIVDTVNTVDLICRELSDFIEVCQNKKKSGANVTQCGIDLDHIMEAYYEASKNYQLREIDYGTMKE